MNFVKDMGMKAMQKMMQSKMAKDPELAKEIQSIQQQLMADPTKMAKIQSAYKAKNYKELEILMKDFKVSEKAQNFMKDMSGMSGMKGPEIENIASGKTAAPIKGEKKKSFTDQLNQKVSEKDKVAVTSKTTKKKGDNKEQLVSAAQKPTVNVQAAQEEKKSFVDKISGLWKGLKGGS